MSLLIAFAFVVILGALVLAGVFMIRGGDGESKSGRMMRALSVRIGVSVALFVCILVAWRLGWIHPSGIPLGR
ncbi:MAG: DUF2909 domain-containing protein [Burkholderiales bacterium]|nr:DUF2909 domain-containing protein [Burkholderiales bacterium]